MTYYIILAPLVIMIGEDYSIPLTRPAIISFTAVSE